MSGLQLAWMASLLVTLTALPVGIIRMIAYRSGEIDHTATLRLVALLGLAIGGLALVALVATSLALLL